jgi:predicted kinase
MSKQQIKVLIGVSGSGKSAYSQEYIRNYPNYVRVNRDSCREQFTGLKASVYNKRPVPGLEKSINDIQHENIRFFLNAGKSIIVDNCHLKQKYINEILDKYNHLVDIELVFINTNVEICKARVCTRDGSNTDYIDRQIKDYSELEKYYSGKNLIYPKTNSRIIQDLSLPKAVIFDIDGTLSDSSHRNIYDGEKVYDDNIIPSVVTLVRFYLSSGYNIIFMSGREDKYEKETQRWLEDKVLLDKSGDYFLYMRNSKDQRRDSIVKTELFKKHVEGNYYVEAVFDDRLQVLEECWSKLGLFTINVNQGNIRF